MRIPGLPIFLILFSCIAAANVNTGANPSDTQLRMGLHMREACKDVCREARTAGEVSRCVTTEQALQGASSFDQAHPICALAKRNYLAAIDATSGQNSPERYG